MERKTYVDISRLKVAYSEMFDVGEHIVVQTKVDGANSSFTYDKDTRRIIEIAEYTFPYHII